MYDAFLLAARLAAKTTLSPFSSQVQEILSLVGDGVVSIDYQGTIILVNKAAEALFGYTSTEIVGCPIDVLIPSRFHHQHRMDVQDFCGPEIPVRRAMGRGREVLGRHKDGHELAVEATLSRQVFAGQQTFTAVIRDVTGRRLVEQQRLLVANEVAHRLRNTMAVVNSIVSLTARGASSLTEFKTALLGRFAAISRTNDLLIGNTGSSADLRSLLLAELAPFRHENDRISLSGPSVSIADEAALALAMIIHELATNAAKYGSLSTSKGTIGISWKISPDKLDLVWQELGGPTVVAPKTHGFGSSLVSLSLQAHGGKAYLTYPAVGVCCVLSLPLSG
jgi:PAS domain S-box-containing protein